MGRYTLILLLICLTSVLALQRISLASNEITRKHTSNLANHLAAKYGAPSPTTIPITDYQDAQYLKKIFYSIVYRK